MGDIDRAKALYLDGLLDPPETVEREYIDDPEADAIPLIEMSEEELEEWERQCRKRAMENEVSVNHHLKQLKRLYPDVPLTKSSQPRMIKCRGKL